MRVVLTSSLLLSCAAPPESADTAPATHDAGGGYSFHPFRCMDPAARTTTEAFDQWTSTEWAAQGITPQPEGRPSVGGWGAIVADFDLDGGLDIYVPNEGPDTLWLSSPAGGWRLGPTLPSETQDTTVGGVAADFDGDGDLDLLLASRIPQYLLINQGDGTFEHQAFLGVQELGFGVTAADVDGDGDLDAVQAGFAPLPDDEAPSGSVPPGYPVRLALNNGDGTFSAAEAALPEAVNDGYPFVVSLLDVDGDLDPDMLVANDFANIGTPNQLWRNDDGTFTNISTAAGLDLSITSMGVGVSDINRDGVPDFALTGTRELALVESQASGVWARTENRRSYLPETDRAQDVGWGVEFGDIDNDGREDLVTGFGFWPPMPTLGVAQPDAIHIQQPDGTFTDVAASWGMDDDGWTRGVLLVDLNDDGWLDVIRRRLHAQPRIDLARCGTAQALVVELPDASGSGSAVGSRVELTHRGVTQTRWLLAGGHGLASGGPPRVHFGLGDTPTELTLRIFWPDGTRTTLNDVPSGGRLTITR